MNRPPAPAPVWYTEAATIDRWVCGVFEGGGAKGVAFSGALLAMRELHCWFSAVAGASAGAITAALIAAGLTPEQIDEKTEGALSLVRTGVWKGIARLRDETGYFPSEVLTDWLDALLQKCVGDVRPAHPRSRVTFADLYEATGIELNVVAADLSLRRQIIFSHHQTPRCSVADAVAASSAIPFAFPSRLLAIPVIRAKEEDKQEKTFVHHTIVDGGVWSNFPMFVFEDSCFRELYGRDPRVIGSDDVIGFLLDEGEAAPITGGDDVVFASQRDDTVLAAYEWTAPKAAAPATEPALGERVAAWLLWPFAFLGRAVELNGRVERGRWAEPQSTLVRNLVHGFNGLFSGMYPLLFGAVAVFAVGLGAWQIIDFLVRDQLRVWPTTDWTQPMSWVLRPGAAALVLIPILVVTLATFAAALGVLANRLLLRASRRLLFGLASTYVAGPGAPQWATLRPNIVALPIPPSVGTLSFDLVPELRRKVIDDAHAATKRKVSALIGARLAIT
jgi:predicted acylesterase/phospholipase RssA